MRIRASRNIPRPDPFRCCSCPWRTHALGSTFPSSFQPRSVWIWPSCRCIHALRNTLRYPCASRSICPRRIHANGSISWQQVRSSFLSHTRVRAYHTIPPIWRLRRIALAIPCAGIAWEKLGLVDIKYAGWPDAVMAQLQAGSLRRFCMSDGWHAKRQGD